MKEKIASLFASLGAFITGCFGSCGIACFAAGCCGGPALLGFIGLSGSTLKFFEKLTPVFLAITVISLGYGFYKAYSTKKSDCCPPSGSADNPANSCCEKEKPKSFFQSKAFLWVVTILCAIMWVWPFFSKNETSDTKNSPCCSSVSDTVKTSCCPQAYDSTAVMDTTKVLGSSCCDKSK